MSNKRSSLPEISAQTKATWTPIRHDISAGGVAYRRIKMLNDARPSDTGSNDTGCGDNGVIVSHPRIIGQNVDVPRPDGDERTSKCGEIIEVALIATRGGRRWQLPKGSREAGESPLQTAIREVHEEVGLRTTDEGFLKSIDYWYWDTYRKVVPELVHKSVDFYLLRVVGGALSDSSYEVDAVGWFTIEHALSILTFAGEREVLALAQSRLKAQR